jgi:spermidine synthase
MNPIKKEMMALVGGCVTEGNKILVPQTLAEEFNKITTQKFEIFTSDESNSYDLIIEERPGDLTKIYEKLNDEGIYITTPKSLTDKELFSNLSELFWIVLPYYYLDENLQAKPLVFASKKYHPTADIVRHRSDFVENARYYDTDVHIAAFTLPKYLFEEIKDSIKI